MFFPRYRSFGVDLEKKKSRQRNDWLKKGSLTALPSKTCSRVTTTLTAAGSSKVRKAKPREVPFGSRMIVHASTFPYVRINGTREETG